MLHYNHVHKYVCVCIDTDKWRRNETFSLPKVNSCPLVNLSIQLESTLVPHLYLWQLWEQYHQMIHSRPAINIQYKYGLRNGVHGIHRNDEMEGGQTVVMSWTWRWLQTSMFKHGLEPCSCSTPMINFLSVLRKASGNNAVIQFKSIQTSNNEETCILWQQQLITFTGFSRFITNILPMMNLWFYSIYECLIHSWENRRWFRGSFFI